MLIKIFGAGSIGNHITHAARTLGWEVIVCDISDAALERMERQIYPGRYGSWDPEIRLFRNDEAPRGDADIIFIGTPPAHHLPIAIEAAAERPRAIVVEKPLCLPSLELAEQVKEMADSSRAQTRWFVGYDHAVGRATRRVEQLLAEGLVGEIQTIDVAFREHWGGIFDAHPWLDGPHETYLGFWRQGGGASGEHSHAINLWQQFALATGGGRVAEVQARLRYRQEGEVDYDDLCALTLRTEGGLVGRVVQDVVTRPSTKEARIQGEAGAIEWVCGASGGGDAVYLSRPGDPREGFMIPKTRPEDFIEELKHVRTMMEEPRRDSPLDLDRGLDTMMVIAAAHCSEATGRRVTIDYDRGYSSDALRTELSEYVAGRCQ